MKLIYQGFDGLDVTFQGILPKEILAQLAEARDQAQEAKKPVMCSLGPHGLLVEVAEMGGVGGFRYRFSTGEDGEVWFVSHSDNAKGWGIRVSVRSASFLVRTFDEVWERLYDTLGKLGAWGVSDQRLGLVAKIARADYCFDFFTEEAFLPRAELFVAHQRTKKGEMGMNSVTRGEVVESIRVGSMPGRQVALYNKSLEILAAKKLYWNDVWGMDKRPKGQVWRVEVRLGKEELDKWDARSAADFKEKAGTMFAHALQNIRYVRRISDANRSRWPLEVFWEEALSATAGAFGPAHAALKREKLLEGLRLAKMNEYLTHISGMVTALTALKQRRLEEAELTLSEISEHLAALKREDAARMDAKFSEAERRFGLLR
ncbi:MAG: hypothetical protein COY40_00655 [Alphaproteobacteria bacterium CG_4_10_14_0_8_um_filter_53_9]|nr:MAG: hypothetical protein COY40_00655 [Alphaproteobacteria bacterium CG_4_10_14_0_8_um_filter_53_9]